MHSGRLRSWPIYLVTLGLMGLAHGQSPSPSPAPALTLDDAIHIAQAHEPGYATAAAESAATALERKDAKAALLPSAILHGQYLYTQSNSTAAATKQGGSSQALPVFIANNAVHEYVAQAQVTETVGLAGFADVQRASAAAARARAELEISRRGLVSTVVGLYYNVAASAQKLAVAQRASDEAARFLDLTQKRESGREVAHSDVLKARLGQQQRERELRDAQVAAESARLDLGVLLYPDPTTAFTLAEEKAPPALPDRQTVDTAAKAHNPEIRSAMAALEASKAANLTAVAGLLPDLSLNYSYGIDAPQFSRYGPDGARNLGYSASATLDLPLWNWLTSERKVKEARLRAHASEVALSAAQRRLIADLITFYNEADVARQQLASLEASVADARESLRLTNLRYVNGESTVLEVVDAENTLITAENAQADGLVRYHVAFARLETLTGAL